MIDKIIKTYEEKLEEDVEELFDVPELKYPLV